MNRAAVIEALRLALSCAERQDWRGTLDALEGLPSNAAEPDDEITLARVVVESASVKAGGTAPQAAIDSVDCARDSLRRLLDGREPVGSPLLWINTALSNLNARRSR
jgi:hypothetical protein